MNQPSSFSSQREVTVVTNDGVRLAVSVAGEGEPLVLLHGWSQSAALWREQIEHFSRSHQVFAIDMRGHGRSEKVAHGYRISRLACDLRDVLTGLGLKSVSIVGHSMGCAVIWCYFEQFGSAPFSRVVFADQCLSVVADPAWDESERERLGAVMSAADASTFISALGRPGGAEIREQFLSSLMGTQLNGDERAFIEAENSLVEGRNAAALLFDHAFKNWSDVIERFDVPALVIGGQRSLIPWKSMAHIGERLKSAHTIIFGEREGGSHYMFMENPDKFNSDVESFLIGG